MDLLIIIFISTLIPLLIAVGMYLYIRNARRREAKRQALINTLEEVIDVRGQTIEILKKQKQYEHFN